LSLRVVSAEDRVRVSFPAAAVTAEKVHTAAAQVPSQIAFTCEAGDVSTTVEFRGPGAPWATSNFFAAINDYPIYPEGLVEAFRNSDVPLLSCIVLLPFNDLFARHVLLPSIIRNSGGHAIEILIVLAGFGVDRNALQHFRLFDSELVSIAQGYNLGVQKARGEYVALFHDDCFLDDPLWIDKALTALADGAAAVTPELDRWQRVPVAKAVPLVLRRADYIAAGGYDEYYMVGVEDMDLTVTLLSSGREVRQVPIGYRHLRGMGTSLIIHEEPHQLKLLFGYQVLPSTVISQIHRDMMQRLLNHFWIRMLEGDYHLRFLKKHGEYLASEFSVDIAHTAYAYQTMRYGGLLTPEMAYLSNREKLLDAYRGMMNIPELNQPIHERASVAR
jgi:glycosyltransferase involved in cell wall biosynthesis